MTAQAAGKEQAKAKGKRTQSQGQGTRDKFPPTGPSQFSAEYRRDVYAHCAKFAEPQDGRAAWLLFHTVLLAELGTFLPAEPGLLAWLCSPFVALMYVKCFMIFHDMGHHSYFKSKQLNRIFGTLLVCPTATPFDAWVKGHNHHHLHSNNLDRKQYSQTAPWTTETFRKSSYKAQALYTLVMNPLVFWSITPGMSFIVLYKLFFSAWEWLLCLAHYGLGYYLGGWYKVFHMLMIQSMGATVGFFLFHAQHTFDGGYKRRQQNWNYFDNGIVGSSFLQLPEFLKFFTLGIEYHHIHHLNARVPSYRLRECHEAAQDTLFPPDKVSYLGLKACFSALDYNLYNEEHEFFENAYNVIRQENDAKKAKSK